MERFYEMNVEINELINFESISKIHSNQILFWIESEIRVFNSKKLNHIA